MLRCVRAGEAARCELPTPTRVAGAHGPGGVALFGAAAGARIWNALSGAPGWGYDAWGHVAYVLYLDLFHALPHADQGWSYFHPPLHYLLAWPFCLAGSAQALLRGMAGIATAASLGCALLAARAAWGRRPGPCRPGGGRLRRAGLRAGALRRQRDARQRGDRRVPRLGGDRLLRAGRTPRRPARRDLATGALLGLALWAKASAWVAVGAVFAALLTQAALAGAPRARGFRLALRRSAVIALTLACVAGPLWARNLRDTGALMPTSRADRYVRAAESLQPPGLRTARHYLRFPLQLFADANPLSRHQLGSVWGSLYANVWVDSFREAERDRLLWLAQGTPLGVRALLLLGLLPTGLALAGACLALRDVARGRRRELYLPLLWLALGMLAAEALFAWQMPTWAALKASYLLPASLAFASFLARGVEGLGAAVPRARAAVLVGLGVVAAAALAGSLEGVGMPRRGVSPTDAATAFSFGDTDAAERAYVALAERSRWSVPWIDNRGAVRLARGDARGARELYARAVALESAADTAAGGGVRLLALERQAQLAVATALAGEPGTTAAREDASAQLIQILMQGDLPEARANLGALAAAGGDAKTAERTLRTALTQDPELWPAWENLARTLRRSGRDAEAAEALAEAARVACRPPRGEVRGIGSGENVEWGVGRRWRLRLGEDGRLSPVTIPDERAACARLSAERP